MVSRTSSLLLIALAAALAPGRVQAQDKPAPDVLDMNLEDLMNVDIDSVWGASGFKQQVANAPASITIVTAEEIKRYGYRTLADILRDVPGFYVTAAASSTTSAKEALAGQGTTTAASFCLWMVTA